MTSREEFEDLVTHVRRRRTLTGLEREIQSADFWRALNPELTVSDEPVVPAAPLSPLASTHLDRARSQLVEEGYCQLPPALDPAIISRLRTGIGRIAARGLPANFIWVYDETFALFARACEALAPILGERPQFVPVEFWGFHVAPGDSSRTRWAGFGPHRDMLGVDPGVAARDLPTVLTIWIPLSDVTTLDSCIYVVPIVGDPDYYGDDRRIDVGKMRLQDIRALPGPAGSVLCWTTRLVHWGSRSSQFATSPRVAVTGFFQRRDVAPFGEIVELDGPIPLAHRVRWIYRAMIDAGPLRKEEVAVDVR